MADAPIYLHVAPGSSLPDVSVPSPFRAVLVIDALVTPAWQLQVSKWLVQSGCLYMMAWGLNCSSWHDGVDTANLEQFDYGDIPDDQFVMTTWHDSQSLEDVLYFCKHCARHPTKKLHYTLLLHIAERSDSARLLKAYAAA